MFEWVILPVETVDECRSHRTLSSTRGQETSKFFPVINHIFSESTLCYTITEDGVQKLFCSLIFFQQWTGSSQSSWGWSTEDCVTQIFTHDSSLCTAVSLPSKNRFPDFLKGGWRRYTGYQLQQRLPQQQLKTNRSSAWYAFVYLMQLFISLFTTK